MKRLLAMSLALSTIAGAVEAAPREIQNRERWCRYGSLDGQPGVNTKHEVRKTIVCFVERWPVDLEKVLAIAERESGLNPRAVNPTSGACGVFQAIPTYWPARVAKLNQQVPGVNAGPSCFNGRSNVATHVRMMHNSGFGPWGG